MAFSFFKKDRKFSEKQEQAQEGDDNSQLPEREEEPEVEPEITDDDPLQLNEHGL